MSAPAQQKMAGRDTLDYTTTASNTMMTNNLQDTFIAQNEPCKDWARRQVLCCRYENQYFRASGHKIAVYNQFRGCCPYKVDLDNEFAGSYKKAGCLANGVVFCLCPFLVCKGTSKFVSVLDSEGEEKFTMRRRHYTCWPCVDYCVGICAPCGLCAASTGGFFSYVGGYDYRTIKQPIFGKMETGEENPVGTITLVESIRPTCIGASRTEAMRVCVDVPESSTPKDIASLTYIQMMYAKQQKPSFRFPVGVSCVDQGLDVETQNLDFQAVVDKKY